MGRGLNLLEDKPCTVNTEEETKELERGRERKTAPGSGPRSRTSIILTCIHNIYIYIYTRHVTRFSTYISCLIEFPDDPLDPDP